MWINKKRYFEMISELESIKSAIQEQQEIMPNIIYDKQGRKYDKLIDKHGLIFYSKMHSEHPWWGKEEDNMGVFGMQKRTEKKISKAGILTYRFDGVIQYFVYRSFWKSGKKAWHLLHDQNIQDRKGKLLHLQRSRMEEE